MEYLSIITLIPACISKYLSSKMWDEITYPFSKFNGYTNEIWAWVSNFIPNFIMVLEYLSIITYHGTNGMLI